MPYSPTSELVSDQVGLKMKRDKTKIVSIAQGIPSPVIIGDSSPEVVNEYLYITVQLGTN